jgi:rhodanese-related sulfurtransferase
MMTPLDFQKQQDEIAGIVSVCPLSVYSQSVIPGSINIPLENIRYTRFPFEKDAKVVLYSRTSSGAYIAYRYLTSLGFSNLWVLEGGYEFWKRK